MALLVLVTLLVIDGLALSSGFFDYDGGGDCGGKGCIVHRPERGVMIGVVLGVAILAIALWAYAAAREHRDDTQREMRQPH